MNVQPTGIFQSATEALIRLKNLYVEIVMHDLEHETETPKWILKDIREVIGILESSHKLTLIES